MALLLLTVPHWTAMSILCGGAHQYTKFECKQLHSSYHLTQTHRWKWEIWLNNYNKTKHDDDDDDCFYIVLFSALEQTHCALVACDSEWVSVAFYSAFWIFPKWCAYNTVWLLHIWCHCKAAAILAHILCTPYNHAQVYSITSCKATYFGCMCVYL